MPFDPRHKSRALTDGPDRAPARAMLQAIGFSREDLARPLIGVAHTWIETMPCNCHLRRLAEQVKQGIRAAGGTPMEFNTIAISDGVTMGTEGMKASLVSREVDRRLDRAGRRAATCSTGWSPSSAATRPSPPRPWRCSGSTSRRSCSTAARSRPGRLRGPRRHHPGRVRGGGRSRRGQDRRASAQGGGGPRPAPAAAPAAGSTPPTPWPLALELLGLSPVGYSHHPGDGSAEGRRRPRAGELVMELLARGQQPAPAADPRRASRTPSPGSPPPAARPTRCCTCWPSRARRASRCHRRLRPHQRGRPRCWRTSSPGARYTAPDIDGAGGMPARRAATARGRAARRREARHRDGRRWPGACSRRAGDGRAAGGAAAVRAAEARPEAWSSCAGTSRPRAAW